MDFTDRELYHGSFSNFRKINLSRSKPSNDFGRGFYLTDIFEQAAVWACRKRKQAWYRRDKFIGYRDFPDTYVYKYYLFPSHDLSIKIFDGYTQEWMDNVLKFRTGENVNNPYDIIIGPVADGDIGMILQNIETNSITKDQALVELKFKRSTNQIVLCTEKAVKCLKPNKDNFRCVL